MPPRLVLNGRKARDLRESAKLRQQDVAYRTNLAVSTLRRIESGRENVSLATLGKLATLYKVKPEKLCKWEP
jgi:transcriptional regulator with XRE-family HTH domain